MHPIAGTKVLDGGGLEELSSFVEDGVVGDYSVVMVMFMWGTGMMASAIHAFSHWFGKMQFPRNL